jgi:hypothetical protein
MFIFQPFTSSKKYHKVISVIPYQEMSAMDYRLYKQYTRSLTTINMILSCIYLASFIVLYFVLQPNHNKKYYIQTNQGFMFEASPVDINHPNKPLKIFFD